VTAPSALDRRPRYTLCRRLSQGAFAVLFLVLPFLGTTAVTGTAIALAVGPLDLLEPASAVSAWLAAGTLTAGSAVAVLPFVAVTAGLGSVYCAWICPFGLLSEAVDRARPRAARRWRGRPWLAMRLPRLASLAAFLTASALLSVPLAALLSPPRLASALPLDARLLRAAPPVTLALLVLVLVIDVLLSRRIVCRALCPVGALSALLRARGWRPRLDRARCACPSAPACLGACAWGLDPREMRSTDGCTSCLACVEGCPTGALTVWSGRSP
jgi:ferredoxin-type protein NapH